MRRVIVVIVLLLAASGVAVAAVSKQPKKDIKPAAQAKAVAINVRRSDLPGKGWTSSPPSPTKGNTPTCSFYNPDQSDLTENGDADSRTFSSPDGSEVSSTTGIFVSASQAATAYKRIVQPDLPKCVGELLVKSGGGKIVLRSSGKLAFPSYGDRSAAYRLTVTVKSGNTKVPVVVDLVAVNQGKADIAFFFTANRTPWSAAFEQHVVARVVSRAKT